MTPTRRRRLNLVFIVLVTVAGCGFLVMKGLQANMTYFITPSDTKSLNRPVDQQYRIGGTVKTGSIERLANGVSTRFLLTDCQHDVSVEYTGLLPDLFREGQSVIADGQISEAGIFIAQTVLAKHDKTYMPSELANEIMIQQLNSCSNVTTL